MLVISRFSFEGLIWVLIASFPDLCILFTFSQLVCDPTRVTNTSSTLIGHIYTNFDENVAHVHVCKISISDKFAVLGNRKLNNCVNSNTHQPITYRSFKNFDEIKLNNDIISDDLDIANGFNDVNILSKLKEPV